MYNDVECIFAFGENSDGVIENIHFTTLAVWNFNGGINIFPEVKATKNDPWIYANSENLIFLGTSH